MNQMNKNKEYLYYQQKDDMIMILNKDNNGYIYVFCSNLDNSIGIKINPYAFTWYYENIGSDIHEDLIFIGEL